MTASPATPLSPGFMVVHGNHPESLRDLMVAWMARHPLGALEDELVLVQSNGVAQWLKLSLAAHPAVGVAAALRTRLPARAVWELYRGVLGDLPAVSPFDKGPLTWRLMRMLPTLLALPVFEPLRRFLAQDDDCRKRHQLAQRVADLFDQYQVYRADWLARWAVGDDVLPDLQGRAEAVPAPMLWQPLLWRALIDDVGPDGAATSRAEVHRRFREAAAMRAAMGQSVPPGVPRRLTVFGISSLPRQTLEVLESVARFTQVLLCVHNPCEHDWSHIVAEQDVLRRRRQRPRPGPIQPRPDIPMPGPASEALHLQAHPLLAAWGKQGRDFIRLLDDYDQREGYEPRFHAVGQRIDLFSANGGDTLLRQLQDDIRELRPLHETRALWPAVDTRRDRSIAFHLAHSPQREVEVLHDQLLRAFGDDPTLRPRDIIVMVPDVADYAPHIQAVFGLLEPGDARHIPFNVADQGARQQDPLLGALDLLLRLPRSRLGVSDVLDLLDVPAVRARFGIDEDDLPLLHQWLEAARVRWGLHARHRERLDLPGGIEQNSWRFGLRRMLLGYAAGRSAAWNGIEPLAEVGGLDAALLGPLVRLVDALEATWLAFGEPAAPAQWGERLRALLQDFFAPDPTSAAALTILRAQEALGDWERVCADAGLQEALPPSVVREHWLGSLEPPSLRQPFFGGGVTFASLMPMRAIPFRRIALLGMNDGDYPRTRPPMDFDLMARGHRAGDRSRREDDRYLFLEALLSARDHLHVSWVGRGIHDNEERPPSVLVAQLRDHLAAGWRSATVAGPADAADAADAADSREPGRALLRELTLAHRLQPFHPAYFQDGPYFSYANEWRASLEGRPPADYASADAPPLPALAAPQPLTLRSLGRFVRNPVRAFFEQRLDVRLDSDDPAAQDQEPFAIDALENWQLQDELIQVQRAAVEAGRDRDAAMREQLRRIARRGELPHGPFADQVAQRLATPMERLFERYGTALAAWPRRLRDEPLQYESADTAPPLRLQDWLTGLRTNDQGGRCRLVLDSSGLVEQAPRRWRYDRLLPHWVAHLAGHLGHAPGLTTWVVSKAGEARFQPLAPEQAAAAWNALLRAWQAGMRRPLRYSVGTATVWLKAMTPTPKDPAPDPARARELVQAQHAKDLQRDAYFARAWPSFDAFYGGDELGDWACELLQPMRDALGTPPSAEAGGDAGTAT